MSRQAISDLRRVLSYNTFFPVHTQFLDGPKTLATKANRIRTIARFSFIGNSLIGQGFVSCWYNNIKRQVL